MIATGCAIECRAGELSMCVDSSSHSSPPSGYAITTLCNRNVPTPAWRAARCNLPVPRMRTWVFRSQAPGAEGSGGIAVAAWITASQPAKITGNRDSRPRSSRSASTNSSLWGELGRTTLALFAHCEPDRAPRAQQQTVGESERVREPQWHRRRLLAIGNSNFHLHASYLNSPSSAAFTSAHKYW